MKLKHKIFFLIAVLLAIISWSITIYYWDRLPNTIPIHFGFNGQADSWADKSMLSVFLLPLAQSILVILMGFLYHKPQYSDMPTTMWLMALNKKSREHAFELIRSMLAGTAVWIGILFTYITYGANASAVDPNWTMSPLIVISIIGFMLVWLVSWSVKVYVTTKRAISKIQKN